jgi:hypothetical protein
VKCEECGVETNLHAEKIRDPRSDEEIERIDPDLGGILVSFHTCPECGKTRPS